MPLERVWPPWPTADPTFVPYPESCGLIRRLVHVSHSCCAELGPCSWPNHQKITSVLFRFCCAALQKCKQWTRACTISCSELLRTHLMAQMASVEFQGYKPKDIQRILIITIMLLWFFAAGWTDVLAQKWRPHDQEVKAWAQMGLSNGQSA